MRDWSMGDAIMAGFRLIRREPLAFLAWAAVYAVVGLGPQALNMVVSFNTFAALGSGRQPDPVAMSQALGPLQALQPFTVIAVLLNSILLYGAVFRAILFPDDRRFGYLRVGGREMWLVLTMIALFVILVLAMLAMMIPMFLVIGVGVAAAGGGGGAGGGLALAGVLLFPVLLGVLAWGALRMSLALPMAFATRRFPIPEAWRETKGHALRLLGVFAVIYLMLIVTEVLLFGIGASVALAVAPMEELVRLMQTNPIQLLSKVNPVVWLLAAAAWSVFGAGINTVLAGASAQVYKDLRGPDHADVFS